MFIPVVTHIFTVPGPKFYGVIYNSGQYKLYEVNTDDNTRSKRSRLRRGEMSSMLYIEVAGQSYE